MLWAKTMSILAFSINAHLNIFLHTGVTKQYWNCINWYDWFYGDFQDNHYLMKLHNHKLDTQRIQTMHGFPMYTDYNIFINFHKKCLPSNRQIFSQHDFLFNVSSRSKCLNVIRGISDHYQFLNKSMARVCVTNRMNPKMIVTTYKT